MTRKWKWIEIAIDVALAIAILGIAYLVFREAGICTAIATAILFIKAGPWVTVTVTPKEVVETTFDRVVIKPLTPQNISRHFGRYGPLN